jgi:hypothetical protein
MLIMVAVSILVLTAMAAFVVDYGILWMSRRQAQNAADAGALAGAVARVYDDPSPTYTPGGVVEGAAKAVVGMHQIWNEVPPAGAILVSDTCPPGASGGGCVQVEVFRDGTNGSNTLPVFFAPLLGIPSQKTRAIANAQAADANGTTCLKPWLIPDKFLDNNGNGEFDLGVDEYNSPLDHPIDTDGWPPEPGEATGWTMLDVGTTLVLDPQNPGDAIQPSNYFQVGPSPLPLSITGCVIDKTLGDWIDTNPGVSVGQVSQGLDELLANGPVVVPIGMFSPQWYVEAGEPHGNFSIQIQNMMGFEIVSHDHHGAVLGTITSTVGELRPGPTVGGGQSLVKQVVLVR